MLFIGTTPTKPKSRNYYGPPQPLTPAQLKERLKEEEKMPSSDDGEEAEGDSQVEEPCPESVDDKPVQ